MKLLLKHCDILAAGGAGFRCLENAYLGVDGDSIDYIGTEPPHAPYDREKDLSGRLGRKVKIAHKGKKGRIELEYYNEQDLETLLALLQHLNAGGGVPHG